jgi:hypothetical protein
MLKPAEKSKPPLIHHPSTVLDHLCAFDLANDAWAEFDEKLSKQLAQWEERNRAHITPRALRQSLGR